MQRWLDLAFLHAPMDPELLRPLFPQGVEPDLFPDESGRERAWVGLVAFRIKDSRLRFGPKLPWFGDFAELNVRTYVRREGFGPAVYFLSLDAPRLLTNTIARRWFGVPYSRAVVTYFEAGDSRCYQSNRMGASPAATKLLCHLGEPLPPSQEGTLEYFLTERYRLFATRRGKLITGEVEHLPYRLRRLEVLEIESNHAQALGLPEPKWAHACFSEGVASTFYAPVEVE
jgi:uncharacterized protein YqjF (DUF2071 family)